MFQSRSPGHILDLHLGKRGRSVGRVVDIFEAELLEQMRMIRIMVL